MNSVSKGHVDFKYLHAPCLALKEFAISALRITESWKWKRPCRLSRTSRSVDGRRNQGEVTFQSQMLCFPCLSLRVIQRGHPATAPAIREVIVPSVLPSRAQLPVLVEILQFLWPQPSPCPRNFRIAECRYRSTAVSLGLASPSVPLLVCVVREVMVFSHCKHHALGGQSPGSFCSLLPSPRPNAG